MCFHGYMNPEKFIYRNTFCPPASLALHCPKSSATAKLLQSCLTLCNPIEGSPLGSPIPGILQARTLEWVAISFSKHESEKWKLSLSVVSDSLRPYGLQPTRLLCLPDFPGKSTGVGCHCLLPIKQKQMFFWNSLAFSMIQQMLAIWSLVSLPFLNPSWTSGSSCFTCWSLA